MQHVDGFVNQTLPAKGLLLQGFPKDLATLKKILKTELDIESEKWSEIEIEKDLDLKKVKQIESKFEVRIEIKANKRAVITGCRREEAMAELSTA